jgi:hypothetical protein
LSKASKSIHYTLRDLGALNYDKVKKFADLTFPGAGKTRAKVAERLRTTDRKVVDRQIKRDIYSEVRRIQARVDARKYQEKLDDKHANFS